jgi:hypothetical protein
VCGARALGILVAAAASAALLVPCAQASAQSFSVVIDASLGPFDRGLNLGSVFEAETAPGSDQLTCRAGFGTRGQTYGSSGSRVLQFTCRRSGDDRVTFESLGRPMEEAWRPELRTISDGLIDLRSKRIYSNGRWRDYDFGFPQAQGNAIATIQRVGNDDIYFLHSSAGAYYQGRKVATYLGSLRTGSYYDGRIYLAYYNDGFFVDVCDWTPAQDRCLNYRSIALPEVGSVIGLTGWRGDLYITGGNVYEERRLPLLRIQGGETLDVPYEHFGEPGSTQGQEFYGTTVVADRLVAGHYPSGHVLDFADDPRRSRMVQVPYHPDVDRMPINTRAEGREVQTAALFGGSIWLGMWPWGLLMEGDEQLYRWRYHRLFTRPELKSQWLPFQREMERTMAELGDEADQRRVFPGRWSQRIVSAAPVVNGFAFALGMYRQDRYDPEVDYRIPREETADYGTVKVLRLADTLAAPIIWPDSGETTLTFTIADGRMSVLQDGVEITSIATDLAPERIAGLEIARVGDGLYGAPDEPFYSIAP